MAAVSVRSTNLAGVVLFDYEYESTTVTGVGETFDADLIRFVVTNLTSGPVSVTVYRQTGAVWRTAQVPPGVTSFNAGGQVRKLSDVPGWTLSVAF